MYGERGADFGLGIWKHIDPESEFKFHQLICRQQEYLRFGPGQWQCRLGLEAGWILDGKRHWRRYSHQPRRLHAAGEPQFRQLLRDVESVSKDEWVQRRGRREGV